MRAKELIAEEKKAGTKIVTELKSKVILESIGVPTTGGLIVKSEKEAVKAAEKIGYPVVLKIHSPSISHKSDVGGVKAQLVNEQMVLDAYKSIIATVSKRIPEAEIEGINVQKMAPAGVEIIIGTTTDSTFGPVIMFGMGGVLAELIKDVSFRVIPINKGDADSMVREIKGFPILEGYRGSEGVDLVSLRDALLKVSALVEQCSEIMEMDINPIFATPKGIVAADSRIILKI
jgi:acyl-CoA synthetase (NDP forming)